MCQHAEGLSARHCASVVSPAPEVGLSFASNDVRSEFNRCAITLDCLPRHREGAGILDV
jgi:hypothetical protein